MNKFLWLIPLFLSLNSCKKDFKNIPACTQTIKSEVQLQLGYLGECAWGAEGAEQPMKVTITIDGLKNDANGVGLSYMKTYTFNKTNQHNGGTAPNSVFPIEIPECGTFVITVNVRGKDTSCFKCCHGASPFDPKCGTSNPSTGIPNFRGVSIQLNTTSQSPPPPVIQIKVEPTTCEDCGC
jgi:hypothetical protein